MCENCRKASYELKLQTGTLILDLPKIIKILDNEEASQ